MCPCLTGAFPRPGVHVPGGGPEQPGPQLRRGVVLLRKPLPLDREAHAAGVGASLLCQGDGSTACLGRPGVEIEPFPRFHAYCF